MQPWQIILIVVTVLLFVAMGVLYYFGSKMQKKSSAQRAEMEAAAQNVSMLVIDKKVMKLKDAGLPKMVLDQTPKYLRNSKLPIVKAKIGPQIMSLICDDAIFDQIPVKAEVKAQISGIYIIGVKNLRGVVPTPVKRKGFLAKLRKKQSELEAQVAKEEAEKKNKKIKKNQKK